jgi:hypothetical protein
MASGVPKAHLVRVIVALCIPSTKSDIRSDVRTTSLLDAFHPARDNRVSKLQHSSPVKLDGGHSEKIPHRS